MSNIFDQFITGADRTSHLSLSEFEAKYRFVRPVVVTKGATHMSAFERWSLNYLRVTAGSATVSIAEYRFNTKDYDTVVRERTTLDVFIRELMDGTGDRCVYLFNNPSCVFVRNEQREDLHSGWASTVNPGLALLADDFVLPSYIRPEDYVLAALVLGSERNGTDFHYDHGGEAKLLVQLRGKKRLLLFPPSAASIFGMCSPFSANSVDGRMPNPSRVLTCIDSMTPKQAAALSDAGGLYVDLQPGDIVYWPAFWLHDVTNLDGPNLAIAVFIDEVHLSSLLIRHLLLKTFTDLNTILQSHRITNTAYTSARAALRSNDESNPSLRDLFQCYENFLMSDACRHLSNLSQWNAAHPSSFNTPNMQVNKLSVPVQKKDP